MGGRLTPEQVVEDARAEDSPLHSHFTWDDAEAAQKYRLNEARALIRIRVEVRMDEVIFMAPYFVREPDRKGQGYISVERARSDTDTAREVLLHRDGPAHRLHQAGACGRGGHRAGRGHGRDAAAGVGGEREGERRATGGTAAAGSVERQDWSGQAR